ncbi:MAG TPA: cysteine--tRNA ligase [Terriglobales bacterium]|nr:cysteine--tRNA ligase [Terriglobales bacterium]
MEIRLYNTLTRAVEPFVPQQPGRVKMYACGPTVYDFGHIGNFRTFVGVDILQRFLASQGLELDTVMNITDVDDKMIARAREAGEEMRAYADRYTAAFLEDMQRLRILLAKHLVRATDFIPEMVAWIERLVAGGFAYEREGSVYFRLASFPAYGRLSGKDLGGLQAGARVDVDEYEKEEARDFVLWKAWREGEPSWPSPWGPGRPGWHIECSVMAEKLLGPTLDIHAGGTDLVFPHHENEIAQVEPLTQAPFVRTWVHMEFLLVNGEKMSKRLGNFYTVRDLMAQGYRPSAIRYLLASVPPRRQLNFTLEGLDQAAAAVQRLRAFQERLQPPLPPGEFTGLRQAAETARAAMTAALADNLNTAEALAAIFELVRVGNTALDRREMREPDRLEILATLAAFDTIFCVLAPDQETAAHAFSDQQVEALMAERRAARQARDWARADALRQQLDAAGVLVEDIKGGGDRWRWK